jgi:hypothetical protein
MEVVDFVDGFVGYQPTLPAVSAPPEKSGLPPPNPVSPQTVCPSARDAACLL